MRVSFPILEQLPSGYFVDESPRGVLALHVDVARALHEAGYGPEHDGGLARSELSGRRPLYGLAAGGERFVVRRFSHGGLLRWLTGARFSDPTRPFRELALSAALRQAGLPTPQVVAARAVHARGGGWYLDLVTRRVERGVDLGFVLGRARRGELDARELRPLLYAAGDLVRRLHRHGFLHADLTPTNLLLEPREEGEEPRLWVLDLDRSVLSDDLGRAARLANLRRLFRYVARREARGARALQRSDYLRFLVGYEKDRVLRKELWRAISAAHRRRSPLHALGWLFETWFGRGADPRDAHGVAAG
ncbi:MAG: hypothetical protein H6828_15240 [Planctomycetes bacterium]|nr:hypothetical protein [Planctomycetota bacterium]